MPKSLADAPPRSSAGHVVVGRLPVGAVWGGFAGAMIGTGISMTIGLFYSSTNALVFAVIAISGVLGGVFGHIMASLLADDVTLTGYASGSPHASRETNITPMTDLCDHKALKDEQQTKLISNQEVMAKINSMRAAPASLSPCRPGAQVFELIVSAAHKTEASGRADRGSKTLS